MYFNFYLTRKILNLLCIVAASLTSLVIFLIVLSPKPMSTDAHSDDSVELPVLMYHGLIKNPKHQNRFMISPDFFEKDLQYINDNGYTTIFVQDLIDYVYNDVPLPSKPIMITFDDGYFNNYLYAFPLIKKYNCKIVLSPIGKSTDDYSKIVDEHADYSHVTWNHIREMTESGLVEIQNHTYNMHSNKKSRIGCSKKKGESLDEYKKELGEDIMKMQERVTSEIGKTPSAFVFPFGAISKEAPTIIRDMGFKCTFCCEGRLNKITKNQDCLYCLCRFIRPNSIDTKQYFRKILKVKPRQK